MLISCSSKLDLTARLGEDLLSHARECIRETGSFVLLLSGGSIVDVVAQIVKHEQCEKWHVILADERHVPCSHADSNYKLIKESLLQEEGFGGKILAADYADSVDEMARHYAKKVIGVMRGKLNKTVFDAAILGVGEDGHIASLFPGHEPWESGTNMFIPVKGSPKPPPCRISIGIDHIKMAKWKCVAIWDEKKRGALEKIKNKDPSIPISHVDGLRVYYSSSIPSV